MKETANNSQLIAACGLYCGACKKFLNEQCAGCQPSEEDNPGLGQPLSKGFQRCKIRNNFVGKIFAFLFNSDRTACIHYIHEHGEEAFAEKMAKEKQMTMKRK